MDPIAALTRFERYLLRVVSERGRAPFVVVVAGVSVWLSLGITTLLMIVTAADRTSFVIGLIISGTVPLLVAPAAAGGIAHLLQALAIARDELHHLAHTDPLTGALNRRAFVAEGTRRLEGGTGSSRHTGRHLVAMVDVDEFKAVNDLHGHGVGDRALTVLAERLLVAAGDAEGVVGRLGGDEFAVVVGVADSDHGIALRRAFHRAGDLGTVVPGLRASVGTVVVDGGSLEDALVAADRELYALKRERTRPADAAAVWETAG
jgi:diguanylate cyclase (GGDEF)-like protein